MGIYLNPGNENFKEMSGNRYYVDKTGMISVLNRFIDEGNKYICVSRPRRFGKTIAGEMLSAYYSKGCDSSDIFAKFIISSDDSYSDKLNTYNVIKIDMNSEYQNTWDKKQLIYGLTEKIKKEMRVEFPDVAIMDKYSLGESIMEIYSSSGQTFVIIIDEYDVLVREKVEEKLFSEYLSFLNGLFKSATLRPAISLAYLTGILPIIRDKVQSKLNNFREYTILNSGELAEYIGFTSEEVRKLCDKYDMDYRECANWYDGYSQRDIEIYNPESVIMCIQDGEFDNYWGKTSTYMAISERIRQNFNGTKDDVIKMISGESVDVNVTRYMNTMNSFTTRSDVFTYLIHLGYLAYDRKEKTCRIPNWEIRQEWCNAIEADENYDATNSIIESSKELLKETLSGNEEAVARALDVSHIHVTSNRSYNDEDALQSAIYLAYIYALNEYTVIRKMTTGKGFADVVYIPLDKSKSAIIIELKRNNSAESGIAQIKEKRYFESLEHYKGNLMLVGINYDENSKTHSCKIEHFSR